MRTRPSLLSAEALPRPPRQQRSLDNRERLKTAALALFGERGYERTSVGDIARRARLAVGGFYLHFRSKRQLLVVLMDDLLQRLEGLQLDLDTASDVRSGLRSLLARAFSVDLAYLGAYRAWQEAVLWDAELADAQNAIHAWTTSRVRRVFAALQQRPGARPDVDTGALARVMDAFFWTLLAEAPRLSKRELRTWIDAATHLVFHALFEDPREGRASRRAHPR